MTPRESVSIQLIDLGGANPKEDLKLFLTAMIFISTGLSEVPKQVKTGKQEQKKFIQNTSFGGVNLVLPIPTQAAPASHSNNTVEKVIYPGSSETQSIPQYYEHVQGIQTYGDSRGHLANSQIMMAPGQYGSRNIAPFTQLSPQLTVPAPSSQAQSAEFMALKEISDNLQAKLDVMSNQIRQIAAERPAASEHEAVSNSNIGAVSDHRNLTRSDYTQGLLEKEYLTSEEFRRPATPTSMDKRLPRQDSAVQTPMDFRTTEQQAADKRHHAEEAHEFRFQIYKLQEQIRTLEHRNKREQSFAKEKLTTYENHIRMLQEDNARLQDSLKVRRDQISTGTVKQIQAKDSLIKELTQKLKESTRVIAEVKQTYKQVR